MKDIFLGFSCFFFVLFLFVLGGCTNGGSPQPADGGTKDTPASLISLGQRHYDKYCVICHAPGGRGYQADGANALSNQNFLSIASDELLRTGISRGRLGSSMSAWGKVFGGPLAEQDVEALVQLIRSWQKVKNVDVKGKKVEGSALRGQVQYDVHCAECHGKKGGGGTYMSINHPQFLAQVSNGYLHYSISKGRPDTEMPAYETKLSPQAINDLVVLIRSWQKDPNQKPPELPSKNLGEVVLNPKGKAPDFKAEGRFVSIKELKTAYDEKAALVLLDARPPGDYVEDHIPGARSVPFYAAEEFLDQLPKEHWIVTYCACPHAESGKLADALKKNGYPRVKVFNEGYRVWKQRGYPTKKGPTP